MEAKKTEQADLTRKTGFFFNIGLFVAMLLVVTAFEWRNYDDTGLANLGMVNEDVEDLLDIPLTDIPPPPPPKVQQPEIIDVPDDEVIEDEIELDLDVDITEDKVIDKIFSDAAPEEEDTDQIFLVVEEQASFPGGMEAWANYLRKNMKYPSQARRMGIEGRVFLKFVVDEKGNVSNIEILRGIGGGCDEEAVRVLQNAPKWSPGKQRGRAVKSYMQLAIVFKLN
jgi:periplasmic protein TonB